MIHSVFTLRDIKLSLRAKLTLLIEVFLLILITITSIVVLLHEKSILENELQKRGLALATDLSNFSVRPMLYNDLATLRRFINNTVKQEYVRHAYILDNNGKVIMHSELSEIGKIYNQHVEKSQLSKTNKSWYYFDSEISGNQEEYIDIYSPITVSSLRLGTVHLGYSLMPVQKQITSLKQRIILIGIFSGIGGIFLAYLIATYISLPIKKITESTQKIADGNLEESLTIKREDEIGVLINSFNKMTEKLRSTTVSKEYFDNIIGSMNDTLLVVDLSMNIKSVNKAALKILEYEEHELIGENIQKIIQNENNYFCTTIFPEITNKIAVQNYEIEYRTKTGKNIPMLLSAGIIKNKNTIIEGIVLIARDITERKESEKILKESELKYRTLFEKSRDVVYICTTDGKFIDINPAGVELFGYENKEEILKKNIFNDLFEDSSQKEKFQQIISKKGLVKDYEVTFKRKDSKKIVGLITSSAVFDEFGNLTFYQGIIKDITQWRNLELQLRQSQKMEAIGTLAGGIAHDFNNILTVILGYGTLLKQLNKDEALTPYINMLIDATQSTTNMTRSLLAFSRKQILSPKPTNLNDVIKGILKLVSRILREDIELSYRFSNEILTVMVDTGQIEQVMINLVTNARDAMPEGGIISISTDAVVFDDIFIETYGFGKHGSYAMVEVKDNGHGMNEETLNKLFEPFFTTKEIGRGTGLGLSMVYGIIKQHDGYINVESKIGKGTVFRFYLPLIKSEEEIAPPEILPTLKKGSETILISEDHIGIRIMIKNILKQFGYNVIEAENGEEAINKFNENKDIIQLVILDVIMPKKNGKEVYDEIKKIKPYVKAIFISGYDAEIISNKGILQEGINFISKPILPTELLQKIREIMDEK